MPTNNSLRVNLTLASLTLLAGCSSDPYNIASYNASGGSSGSGSAAGTGSTGNTGAVGNPSGGAVGTGSQNGAGGLVGSGSTAGSGGTGGGGGTGGSGSSPASGGASNSGGSGPDVDQMGKENAKIGATSSTARDYLRLGEIRLINNNWGSEALGCDTTMSVFVDQSQSFGWNFNRGVCGGKNNQAMPDTSHPDFPQIEFGIHPFGIGSPLATSPGFTSTTLLPLQIKDIQSASITINNLTISLQNSHSWNISAEFWLSEGDPLTNPSPNVMAELMTWWGWDAGRWPCDSAKDNVSAGSSNYTLCHQQDSWGDASDNWSYYQFRAGDSSDSNIKNGFNGKVDVKALLDYLVNTRHFSPDLWVSRLEVGSEIDDNTSGTVKLDGITFEVNGQMRSQVIAP